MAIVGICRFSLVGRGDWREFRGKDGAEVEAIARERAARLFTPERMAARLASFEALTLASLRAQTDQDFRFIVLASELMPAEYRDRLQRMCDAVPQVVLRFFPIINTNLAQRAVFRELRIAYPQVVQFRLDDDDCLCHDFIAVMKAHTAAPLADEGIFVASVADVMYAVIGGPLAGVYHWPVEFMSIGAAIRHPSKSIYEFGHFGMATRFPKVVIGGRLTLGTHNGTNDTELTPAMIKRRGMVPMDPAAVAAAVERHFPFLTPEAWRIAGLDAPAAVPDAANDVAVGAAVPAADIPAPDNPAADGAGDGDAGSKAADEAPAEEGARWLGDLLETRYRKGFYISDNLFALQHTFRSSKVLYVSFDNLSSVRAPSRLRDPWGYGFAAKAGWSGLGVLCYRPNWFRIPALYEELFHLAERGFFESFQQVVFTGTSMGAYAACAFARLAPGAMVVAFSPQSTLAPGLADWDRRYPSGSGADWSGPFADGATGLEGVGRAWIVHDPAVPEDRRHAERLAGPNVELLRARHSSHFSAQFLRQIGALGTFVTECVAGKMTVPRFYDLYRPARGYRRYLDGLVQQAMQHPDPARRRQLARALRNINRHGLARDLERSAAVE